MKRLFEPVDLASLAVFRIAFGALMLVEVGRYFWHGWIARYYVEPSFHFTYLGFGWVHPWPGDGMYWHFAALGVLATFIAAGFLYRVSAALFCVGFSHVFLIDQTTYLNHLYLVCLLSFLLIFLPANRLWSVDARLGLTRRSDTGPRWALLLLQLQIGLVYFFGGIAKVDGDWLSGVPGAMFLAGWSVTAPLAQSALASKLFAWSGLAFDLLIAPGLAWRRTRPSAAVAAAFFHLTNMQLFPIGIFPWLMLAATGLYFPPSWPRRLLRRKPVASESSIRASRWVPALLIAWFTFQVLMPLRHWLYPYEVNWSEEGHNFSWHMKLRNKSGQVRMFLVDAGSGKSLELDLTRELTPRQLRKMATRPDMIQLFAQHVGEKASWELGRPMEVHAEALVSLNGRPMVRMIDPRADLAAAPRDLRHSPFILPLPDVPPAFSPDDGED